MRFFIFFIALLFFAVTPFFVSADVFTGSLVPECDGGGFGPYCQACDLMVLVQNLINFAVYASIIVATLMFVYAGFLNVTAVAGGAEQLKKARGIFIKVFIGLVIILASWLIVDLIMKTFTDSDFGPWNEIQCTGFDEVDGGYLPTGTIGSGGGSGGGSHALNCPNCENISSFECKTGANCTIAPSMNDKLTDFHTALGDRADDVDISEGWPPTVNHQNACHYNGTCVDLRYNDGQGYSEDRVRDVIRAGNDSGLRVIFETNDPNEATRLQRNIDIRDNVIYLRQITAPHFSVYCTSCR